MLPHRCISAMALFSTSVRTLVNQAFVVFLFMSLLVLVLQWEGRFNTLFEVFSQGSTQVDGVILSMRPDRFNHTKHVLAQLGIPVVRKVPPSFTSEKVDQSLESFVGSRQHHNPTSLKGWSNQMGFVDAMTAFVLEATNTTGATPKRWRFFFDDELALHPIITAEHAKVLIARGLEVADDDGFVFLGICGPSCEDGQALDKDVQAAPCAGTCTHAFEFQPRTAAKFLQLQGRGKVLHSIYMDQNMLEYGRQVKKVWVLGSNLISPAAGDHVGLLHQDTLKFPSTIG